MSESSILSTSENELVHPALDGIVNFVMRRPNKFVSLNPELVSKLDMRLHQQPENSKFGITDALEQVFSHRDIQIIKPEDTEKQSFDAQRSAYFHPEQEYKNSRTLEEIDWWETKIRGDSGNDEPFYVLSLSLPDANAFYDADRRWYNGPFEKSGVRSDFYQIEKIEDGKIHVNQMELRYNEARGIYIWQPIGSTKQLSL